MPEILEDKTIFTLSEVSRSIQKTIAERYKSLYWIKAEMNKLNHYSHSGHCYPELLEKKDGKIIAEMRSILWKMDYHRINRQFIEILGEPLREGITMLFQAGISYDPLYGFSLKIVDIDPTFVLGELEKEKRASILKLKQEGLFDANRLVPFPMVPKRLAIISVETSKGLSDFYKIINGNPWGYRFSTTLFPALLQGDKSIPSIIRQLEVIAERMENYDAVAIIRGGGGDVGLTSYNNYFLAKAIAIFPLPVLTGIGHSTNETVSEMVAYKNAITPSELADFLIQKFHNFALPVDEATERIVRAARKLFEQEHLHLNELVNAINWNSKTQLLKNKTQLEQSAQQLLRGSKLLLKQELSQLQQMSQEMQRMSKVLLKNGNTSLLQIERLIGMLNPIHVLKRGYSIVRIDGKAVHQLDQVEVGSTLYIQVEDGQIESTVTQKIENHGK
ncbi:exodeoxyribonuclease VII large subunit [Sphingobacterium kyonggiense]|uniref:Exodeoxyribonuclease 7 large subunit n=1 Tax=Sphingobacterium kyonggiense TaxID=714075 RepID=A0ABP7YDS8_9SPHI